jgi:ABC-type lipoprotein export system ATPase subunit
MLGGVDQPTEGQVVIQDVDVIALKESDLVVELFLLFYF